MASDYSSLKIELMEPGYDDNTWYEHQCNQI